MSRYDLVINGNPYAVDILSVSDGKATVSVNGVTYQVTLPAGVTAAPQSGSPALQRKTEPGPQAPSQVGARSAGKPAPAALAAAVPEGGESIRAPMPGHILEVLVREGDSVNWGDTVVLMEAMKMENEIKAHLGGTVRQVCVTKGQDVSVNDPLVVIG